jgi:hypothetical protein
MAYVLRQEFIPKIKKDKELIEQLANILGKSYESVEMLLNRNSRSLNTYHTIEHLSLHFEIHPYKLLIQI